jgi:hypothetical protein
VQASSPSVSQLEVERHAGKLGIVIPQSQHVCVPEQTMQLPIVLAPHSSWL